MDIIDIMLAKAMTPQGQTETYVSIANAAASKAEKAKTDAAEAVATVEAAASTIEETQEAANDLLATARETLETAQQAQLNIPDTEDIDAEVKKLVVNTNSVSGSTANTLQVITTYPDNTLNTQNITKLYKATGQNEDGTMTQKAITNALADKASITYVQQQIANIPQSSGNTVSFNFDTDDAGHLIKIDTNGNAVASDLTEEELINSMLQTGTFVARKAVGIEVDYANKNISRIQEASELNMGADFDTYTMYGGRVRCNVADDGTINAFYGDNEYTEDGSNGQVMVYQPKFYYQRVPISVSTVNNGQVIRHETLTISQNKQPGFKLAPIFKDGDNELDYVLLSAYEGAISDDKLTSIVNSKPAANLTITEFESKAAARGTGWHVSSLAAESVNQMLEIVEFGSMNGQTALEAGICDINGASGVNCASLTGSTSSLGNATGHATQTTNEISGNTTIETVAGKRAISYRGVENPWGNLWHLLIDVNIKGDGQSRGGAPYICTDNNYTPGTFGSNYEYIGANLPSIHGWISAMLYCNDKYDWIYLPGECSNAANSLLPVGDNLWTVSNVNENKILAVGGSYSLSSDIGPFYYAADRNVVDSARNNYGARLMFIPTRNNIYTANISKWQTHMGA